MTKIVDKSKEELIADIKKYNDILKNLSKNVKIIENKIKNIQENNLSEDIFALISERDCLLDKIYRINFLKKITINQFERINIDKEL